MRKWFLGCIVVLLVWSSAVYAEPLEGTIMPPRGHWKMGFQYNQIMNQDMAYLKGDVDSQQAFYTLQYGLWDFVTLDFKLGVGDLNYHRDGQGDLDFHKTHFAGGYGFRVKLYDEATVEPSALRWIVGAHHISVHPHSYHDDQNVKQEIIWDGWQLDGLVFKPMGWWTPYLGAKVKRAFLIRKIDDERVRMKSDVELGGAVGCDIRLPGDWFLNLEGRFGDEEAVSAGISYIF